jgi:cytochrome c
MKLNWIVGSAVAMLMVAGQSYAALDMEAGKALAKKSGCFACHSVETKRVGPAWNDVSAKYKGDAGAKDNLVKWIHTGGKGRWNFGTMPAYSPRVPDADIDALAEFILSLKK